jgi:tetraacyldisaccharide 4'-kinase
LRADLSPGGNLDKPRAMPYDAPAMRQNRLDRLERSVVALIQSPDRGEDRPASVSLLLWMLKQISHLYRAVTKIRIFLYEKGIFRHHTLGCQVISVGNLTVGGTGKTPVVEIFARELQKAGRKVAILSRGYKKARLPLHRRLLDLLALRDLRGPPRVVSDGKKLLLDSAMSGDEHVLPRGTLRESTRNIRRANFIFITKSDGAGTEALRERLHALNPKAEIIECRHSPRHLKNVFTAEVRTLDALKGMDVAVVSGIASPGGFEDGLRRLGANLVRVWRFADHHRYTQQEVIDLVNRARRSGVAAIITTEKDAVRFPRLNRWDVPIYFLRVDIEIVSGFRDFQACISRICFR